MDIKKLVEGPYSLWVLIVAVVVGTVALLTFSARASDLPPIRADVLNLKLRAAASDSDMEWLKLGVRELLIERGIDNRVPEPPKHETPKHEE